MFFHGNLTSKYKQIGNAVPVKLAEVIAKDVHAILTDFKKHKEIGGCIGNTN